jgi:predicted ATP-grasp superfamily ATP-dependent carboligase
VLVTDGEQRAALAAVRSLGRAGHRVLVVAQRRASLAGCSRHASRAFLVPDPMRDPAAFTEAVGEHIHAEQVDVLLPISEAALMTLLAARDRFGTCRIPFPSVEVFRKVCDKSAVLALAPRIGIAIPEQRVIQSRAEAVQLDQGELHFPLVLKPWRTVAEGEGGRVKLNVLHAGDRSALEAHLARLPDAAFPLLLQRRIVGPGAGIFLLLWNGELRALFAHRRLLEKPPAGGVSVYSESIAADPALVERSRQLLDQLGWQGVAMVEYKLDAATGVPYLMEINGRLWGSVQLAIDAGVDFPALLVACALGEAPSPVTTWRTGTRLRWEWGNVDHLLARFRRSDSALSLPPGAPGRWQSIRESGFLWRPGDRLEVLRDRDPAPFLLETWRWLRGES